MDSENSSKKIKISKNLIKREGGDIFWNVADIFREECYPGNTMVGKAWHFSLPATDFVARQNYKISFKHGQMNGRWTLFINGVFSGAGYENPVSRRSFVVIVGPEEMNFRIKCIGGLKYKYIFLNDGVEIPESGCYNFGEFLPIALSVPDTRTFVPTTFDSKEITVFQIYLQIVGGKNLVIERRFSEFVLLDNAIRCQTDPDIIASLPQLPPKVYPPYTKKDLINETRRTELEIYLQTIFTTKKIAYYTEVLCFVGLDPISGDPLS